MFIGTDKSELEAIIVQLSEPVDPHMNISSNSSICEVYARRFSMKVAADGRFKVLEFYYSHFLKQLLLWIYGYYYFQFDNNHILEVMMKGFNDNVIINWKESVFWRIQNFSLKHLQHPKDL